VPRYLFPTELGLCAIDWADSALTSFSLPPAIGAPFDETLPPTWLRPLIARVQLHLAGTPQDFSDVSFAFQRVTEFLRRVYLQILAIRAGLTSTYGEISSALGLPPGASRAVAAALGANPWPLLIPCHRIIGANGKMTGFSGPGGIATKIRLLTLEGTQLI